MFIVENTIVQLHVCMYSAILGLTVSFNCLIFSCFSANALLDLGCQNTEAYQDLCDRAPG